MNTLSSENGNKQGTILSAVVIVATLGYFVDVYDLLLFGIVRRESLQDLGVLGSDLQSKGELLISIQMIGMLLGGMFWGIIGDKKGRISVLFASILTYSLANIANGMVTTVEAYAFWRFIAGIGLSGELGIGITVVAESLPKNKRGWGTMIVAGIGIMGALAAVGIYQWLHDWRLCYYIGGGLGILLLLLRINVSESYMYRRAALEGESNAQFLSLFSNKKRLFKYFQCVLIGVPTWFVVGLLMTFSPEFAQALHIQSSTPIMAGKAIALCYGGAVIGDIVSSLLSQRFQNRKKIILIFLISNAIASIIYLNAFGISSTAFYLLCLLLGFTAGYFVLNITLVAEHFGTNIRATVTTTAPNFVRGFLPITILSFTFLKNHVFDGDILKSAMTIGLTLSAVAMISLWNIRETFSVDMNYLEQDDIEAV